MVGQLTGVDELLKLVTDAEHKYESKNEKNNTRKWLVKFSKKVTHYGYILDVLVQHHPEYVSLAWGAMKFLFVVGLLMTRASLVYKVSYTNTQ